MTAQSIVSVQNLNHFFGENALRKQVLFDIDLEIRPKEFVILTGPSGSGKSTLLSLIGCLRSVQTGSLKVLGQELNGANNGRLINVRRHFGYITQSSNLLHFLTAQQNVQMSLELHPRLSGQDRRSKAKAILEAVGLEDRIAYYPDNLSGGQRQ
ncbi:MAG: ATP-binding cassette domain-containing protein, partial [Leptolyngbyaceae cyanobacterium MO_188.B28]|nr:ATP-binding cassette domain-containing protein [Leptolyngbyaceae cyanobacterium MO_188.B28]